MWPKSEQAQVLRLLLLVMLTLPALGEPLSDPGGKFTIVPPKGWVEPIRQREGMSLVSPDGQATIGIGPLSIPLPLSEAPIPDGFTVKNRKEVQVGGRPALRLEVDGVDDHKDEKGLFYFISGRPLPLPHGVQATRGWFIACLAPRNTASSVYVLMEAAVKSIRFED
ncbi:MAG: hypothetical protein HY319_03560 [Armatimonadetes bacterium]|nr:hypothetical protein [Armatimonadota bacterium]